MLCMQWLNGYIISFVRNWMNRFLLEDLLILSLCDVFIWNDKNDNYAVAQWIKLTGSELFVLLFSVCKIYFFL